MLSAVDGSWMAVWSTAHGRLDVLEFSLCVTGHHQLREMPVRGGVYAVMLSEMH